MSSDVMSAQERRAVSSAELAAAIAEADFSGWRVTVVGYGAMGKQHVKALQPRRLHRHGQCLFYQHRER